MKKSILVVTLFHIWTAPAYGEICANGYFNQNLEEDAPVQRLGSALNQKKLELQWFQPANYTETHPFIGKSYQLAKHEGLDFINPHSARNGR